MNQKYSDSPFPFGMGTSFVVTLLALLAGGALAGQLLGEESRLQGFGGSLVLLCIVLATVAGPLVYNRLDSRFAKHRTALKTLDGFGTVQGLRGAFYRLVLYEDGIEIRAFYHRFFLPFTKIDQFSIEKGFAGSRLNIKTRLAGVPDYIVSSDKAFPNFAFLVAKRLNAFRAETAAAPQAPSMGDVRRSAE